MYLVSIFAHYLLISFCVHPNYFLYVTCVLGAVAGTQLCCDVGSTVPGPRACAWRIKSFTLTSLLAFLSCSQSFLRHRARRKRHPWIWGAQDASKMLFLLHHIFSAFLDRSWVHFGLFFPPNLAPQIDQNRSKIYAMGDFILGSKF